MTDLGKAIIPGSGVPANTLYKRTPESFIEELKDENMASLHFTHHQKRRVKNLLRLGSLIQGAHRGEDGMVSMPNLGGKKNSSADLMTPAAAYAST